MGKNILHMKNNIEKIFGEKNCLFEKRADSEGATLSLEKFSHNII